MPIIVYQNQNQDNDCSSLWFVFDRDEQDKVKAMLTAMSKSLVRQIAVRATEILETEVDYSESLFIKANKQKYAINSNDGRFRVRASGELGTPTYDAKNEIIDWINSF